MSIQYKFQFMTREPFLEKSPASSVEWFSKLQINMFNLHVYSSIDFFERRFWTTTPYVEAKNTSLKSYQRKTDLIT